MEYPLERSVGISQLWCCDLIDQPRIHRRPECHCLYDNVGLAKLIYGFHRLYCLKASAWRAAPSRALFAWTMGDDDQLYRVMPSIHLFHFLFLPYCSTGYGTNDELEYRYVRWNNTLCRDILYFCGPSSVQAAR